MKLENEGLLHEDTEEELMEAQKVAKEVDGEAAAEDASKVAKKSAPTKADDPAVDPKTQDKMEKLPGTKTGMINAAFNAMSKMNKKDLAERLKGLLEASEYDDEDEDDMEEAKHKKEMKKYKKESFKEDLDALVSSEATLSEGFRDKAGLIFEAAIQAKLSEHIERLEESYAQELAEEKSAIQEDLVEKVDSYLNYVVENWMSENELAVNTGLRTEIAESFISALHGVFTEHYVAVPEEKTDLFDELAQKVEKLEGDLNEAVSHNVTLSKHVKQLTRESIIREMSYDLSEAQSEKLKRLAEDVDFSTEDSFRGKVETLKESYFARSSSTDTSDTTNRDMLNEETGDVETRSVSGVMAHYLKALEK
jgi:hypothetical protein